ncbi:P-loop containing nucleoside triphosphate hydrolase protein [Chytridium lagenaria]|nr:P-loop containing nucleoside triphosphate hydrolase protein [Chytridium lagenaria]
MKTLADNVTKFRHNQTTHGDATGTVGILSSIRYSHPLNEGMLKLRSLLDDSYGNPSDDDEDSDSIYSEPAFACSIEEGWDKDSAEAVEEGCEDLLASLSASVGTIKDLCRVFTEAALGQHACPSEFQVEAVLGVLLEGRDTLVVQRTGSGKTWAFFLTLLVGMALKKGSLVMVLSPLVSLMADHMKEFEVLDCVSRINFAKHPRLQGTSFAYLKDLAGVALGTLDVGKNGEKGILNGRYNIAWSSPEYMFGPFFDFLRINPSIKPFAFVIDEVHCLIDHGRTYRGQYKDSQPSQSAGDHLEAIIGIDSQDNVKHIVGDIDRPEIYYKVRKRKNAKTDLEFLKQAAIEKDLTILPAIVFCNDVGFLVDRIIDFSPLEAIGFFATSSEHHKRETIAKLKERLPQNFSVFSTSALGIRVNARCVRTVVHYKVPNFFSDMLQEGGRVDATESHKPKFDALPDRKLFEDFFSLTGCRRKYFLATLITKRDQTKPAPTIINES